MNPRTSEPTVRIRIADRFALSMDGQYVAEYDPSRPGSTPDGIELTAHLVTTPDPAAAATFPTMMAALEYYGQSCGWREDGEPNRPLTAFTVQFETALTLRGSLHRA